MNGKISLLACRPLIQRLSTLVFIVLVTSSCSTINPPVDRIDRYPSGHGRVFNGIAVGFVVNQRGGKPLKKFERRRYADQVAAQILHAHPELDGHIDSYAYVSQKLGESFIDLLNSYRQNGMLEPRHREAIREHKLRRRYLMLLSISPVDEKVQLPPLVRPVPHRNNGRLSDYEVVKYQTARVKSVEVQVYDTRSGRRVMVEDYSSSDGGKVVVNERTGKRYTGNSVLAAVSNTLGNKLRYGGEGDYPAAPSKAHTLNYIWQLIAEGVPARIRS